MRNENVVSATKQMAHLIDQLVDEGCTILSVFVDRHYTTDGRFSFTIQVLGDDAWNEWSASYEVSDDDQNRPVVRFMNGTVFAYVLDH